MILVQVVLVQNVENIVRASNLEATLQFFFQRRLSIWSPDSGDRPVPTKRDYSNSHRDKLIFELLR